MKYAKGPGLHYFTIDEPNDDVRLVRVDHRPSLSKRLLRYSALARYLWRTVGISEVWQELSRLRSDDTVQYIGNTDASFSAERIADSKKVVDSFFRELPRRVPLDASRILFVLDGMRPSLYSESELKDAEHSYFGQMRRYFLDQAGRNGYEVLDMQPRFLARHRQDGVRFEFPTDGHWSAFGHGEAAEAVASSKVFQRLLQSEPFPRS